MRGVCDRSLFFFNDTATTEIYTLSLHDALPIFHFIQEQGGLVLVHEPKEDGRSETLGAQRPRRHGGKDIERSGFATAADRKSTRLNSSHGYISYAVFCLKKNLQSRATHLHNRPH